MSNSHATDAAAALGFLVQYDAYDRVKKVRHDGIFVTTQVRKYIFLNHNNKVTRGGEVYTIQWENMKGGIWRATINISDEKNDNNN